jgi:hypothetical protein
VRLEGPNGRGAISVPAAVAIKERGILSGKRVERSERGTPGEFDWIENASAEELLAFIETSVAKH